MQKKSLPLSEVYRLLEPGPVVLLATQGKDGKPNVMTMSWHTMMEFEPPLIGCVVSGNDYSFKALTETRECAIAVPDAKMIKTVVGIGNCSGRTTDKFKKFKLETMPAEKVRAPLIGGACIANLECKVNDASWQNKYNFFVLEVVKAWVNPEIKNPRMVHHRGKGLFAIDGKTVSIPSKAK